MSCVQVDESTDEDRLTLGTGKTWEERVGLFIFYSRGNEQTFRVQTHSIPHSKTLTEMEFTSVQATFLTCMILYF